MATLRSAWPKVAAAFVIGLLAARVSVAEPWVGPGDVILRHDVQLLSDTGILTGTTVSWPIAWSQVVADLDAAQDANLSALQRAAVDRLRARIAAEQRTHDVSFEARLAAAAEPSQLRTFENTPREQGEAEFAARWVGDRFAWKLAGTVVANPDDHQTVRPDGSYIAMSLGNWMVSAGYVDRWWGPGWQGSLILSSNARPVPAISLDRREAHAFDLPVLRWLGPWRFSTFMGQLEADRDYPHALLFGMRGEIRPVPSLQIGLSRTAQWCGDGRPCGLDTFWNLLVGNDNSANLQDQPGNQLAGFDVRWSWPGGKVPLAAYAQGIGEDEAGNLPSKYLGLFGVETWGALAGGSWRAHVEYADTTCEFNKSTPEFGCAYTNVIYTTGYRYRGRAIGHTIDGDGQSVGADLLYVDTSGRRWELLARDARLNREGVSTGHTLATAPAKVKDLSLTHERALPWGNIVVSLGYADVSAEGQTALDHGLRGSLSWRYFLH